MIYFIASQFHKKTYATYEEKVPKNLEFSTLSDEFSCIVFYLYLSSVIISLKQ